MPRQRGDLIQGHIRQRSYESLLHAARRAQPAYKLLKPVSTGRDALKAENSAVLI